VVSAEATVKAIDHERREVTLERADGTTVQLTVGKEVKNLPQVQVGDRVTVDMLEAVTVEVLSPGEVDPGAEVAAASATAEPGERPAGGAVTEVVVVAVIQSIDRDRELATLLLPSGKTETVKIRNPEHIDKVRVGDRVRITYTRAVAVKVSES